MFCTQCGTRASASAKFCHDCGASLPIRPQEAESARVLAALQAYIGDNWDSHYNKVFARLLMARVGGTSAGWTWNWSAAVFPFWFLHRRLYVPFFAFTLALTFIGLLDEAVARSRDGGSPVALLSLPVVAMMGVSGDRLLFSKAYTEVTSRAV